MALRSRRVLFLAIGTMLVMIMVKVQRNPCFYTTQIRLSKLATFEAHSLPLSDYIIRWNRTRNHNPALKAPERDSIKNATTYDGKDVVLYQQTVQNNADQNGIVFLAAVDSSYVDMAINLYFTSFRKFDITNFLFVGIDQSACASLLVHIDVPCFAYFSEKSGNVASSYHTQSFKRKTHYKTKMILDALTSGATVIIVDLDIVFFRNPLPYLNCIDCDIQIQNDTMEGNTGFYMARPTPASIQLHEKALTLGMIKPDLSNQKTIGRTLKSMSKWKKIKSRTLSVRLFPCGSIYFEENRIMFQSDGSCDGCVLVHNNWIVSKEAKVYRFKETGLWQVDIDGYYSDPNRKYLTFDNPFDFGVNRTMKYENVSLKSALYIGYLLNRTVILPKFHCYGCYYSACKNRQRHCSLGTFYKISSFDEYFSDSYREHVFLDHPKVPRSVKEGKSRSFLINSTVTEALQASYEQDDVDEVFTPSNITRGATAVEIQNWFKTKYADVTVLMFRHLYDVVDTEEDRAFAERLSKGLIPVNYRQYPLRSSP